MEPRRAERVPLAADATTSAAFLAITAECIAHWRANVGAIDVEGPPDALHQTRVGIRRLRSALSLFGRAIDDPQLPWLNDELRALTAPLGSARDLDVLLAAPESSTLAPAERGRLEEQRVAAHRSVQDLLASTAWSDTWSLVDRFRSHAPWGLDPDPPAVETATQALDRRWRRVHAGGADLAALTSTQRHRVRIQAKKLRYAAQFFADLFPGREDPDPWGFAEVVGVLQDRLGAANDAHTRALLLASVGAPVARVDEDALVLAAQGAADDVLSLRPFWT